MQRPFSTSALSRYDGCELGVGDEARCWARTASSQDAAAPPISFMNSRLRSKAQWTAAFVQRLRELGWIEGRTILIEYRWAEGRGERAAQFASELVALKVDIIVTSGTPTVLALKRATSVIPIVLRPLATQSGLGWSQTCNMSTKSSMAPSPATFRSNSRPSSISSST
jgi:ABC transporter substrate binding protein